MKITAGGNLIDYPYELKTRTAELTTTKIMWNSVISTPGAQYMCIDIKNMYLETPLDRYEYMRMPFDIIPDEFKKLYNLTTKNKNGFFYGRQFYCLLSVHVHVLFTFFDVILSLI